MFIVAEDSPIQGFGDASFISGDSLDEKVAFPSEETEYMIEDSQPEGPKQYLTSPTEICRHFLTHFKEIVLDKLSSQQDRHLINNKLPKDKNGKILGNLVVRFKRSVTKIINDELQVIFPPQETPSQVIWGAIRNHVLHKRFPVVFFDGVLVDFERTALGEELRVKVERQGASYKSWPQNAKQQASILIT